MNDQLPPVPKLNPSIVLRRRDRLAERLSTTDDVIACARQVLKIPASTIRLIQLEIEPKLKSVVDRYATCWRLAGVAESLNRGVIVGMQSWQATAHWAAAAIIKVIPRRFKDAKGYLVRFRILTGLAAGTIIDRFWSKEMTAHAARKAGFGLLAFALAFPIASDRKSVV